MDSIKHGSDVQYVTAKETKVECEYRKSDPTSCFVDFIFSDLSIPQKSQSLLFCQTSFNIFLSNLGVVVLNTLASTTAQ